MEKQFTNVIAKFIISIFVASRDGLLETEITSLLENSNLVQGEFCRELLSIHNCYNYVTPSDRLYHEAVGQFFLVNGAITSAQQEHNNYG